MQRVGYIDSMKGLLMLIVVAHHIPYYALSIYGCENEEFATFMDAREFVYMPYFMTAFFVCTGMCSRFDKPFADFARGVVRIAIPSYLILRHTQWFIDAFIFAKLFYWFINRYVRNPYLKLAVVAALALAACWLHGDKFYYEAFAWHHGLEMLLFIYIGQHARKWLTSPKLIIAATIAYVAMALVCFVWLEDIPYFEKVFHVSVTTFVPFVVISLCGVMMTVGLAKLADFPLLRFVGRMSLVFFLMHLVILLHLTPLVKGLINGANGSMWASIGVFAMIWVATTAGCMLTAKALDHPRLRWVIGK